MKSITNFILKKPVLVMAILLMITVFFGYQIVDKARIETNLNKYMPQDHPAFKASDHYEELFSIEDAIIVAVENNNGIFNSETLNKITEITEKISDLKGVKSDDVRSLATADNIIGSDFGLEVDPFFTKVPVTKKELTDLKRTVKDNEMVWGRIVSKDSQVALIQAELKDSDLDRMALYKQVKEILDNYQGPEKIYVAGQPVVEGTLAYLMPRDMKKMVPIVILVIILVLLITLRSLKSTILTLSVVLFSTIWVFGLMAYLKIPIYSVSTMIPVMLIALGVADGIHLLSHLHQKIKDKPDISLTEAVHDMIKHLWKPVVMTSVTTAVGFISLLTSEVYPIKYFGLFTAFGVMTAMIYSLVFIPAGLKLLKLPRVKRESKEKDNQKSSFYTLADKVLAHKKQIFVITLIIIILGIFGIQKVGIDSSLLSKFERDEAIVRADRFINQHFGGTTGLNVIFIGENKNDLKKPEYLKDIWKLQQELEKIDKVGDTYGITDYLRRINKVMNENQESYNRIPDSNQLVAQYLLLYSMSGDPEDLNSVIDYDYRRVNLRVSLKGDNAKLINKVIDRIERYAQNSSLGQLKVNYAGSAYTNMVFTDLILKGQVQSLFISIILVIILLGILFRSITAGVFGSLPIVITAIINFGVMGYLGISLNTTTALISSIAVGMGIDYSIHLLSKYQLYGKQGISSQKTARKTMDKAGRAIAFNAVVVIAGFMVLMFSNFPPNRELGWLVSLSMFNAFIFTLTLVVVLIDKFRPKFIMGQKESK